MRSSGPLSSILRTRFLKAAFVFLLLFSVSTSLTAEDKHITTSDGVDLFVEVSGKGTPCLFIHGGPGAGSYWMKKFSGEMLEQNFQMIYLDQRGAGRSASPKNGDYSMERMVKDFEEVRVALGIKQWITMGHSFAGILQVGYAQRRPEVIKGMIMLNVTLNLPDGVPDVLPKACEFLKAAAPNETCPETTLPAPAQLMTTYKKLRERDLFWKMGYASKASEEKMNAAFREVPYNHDEENKLMEVGEYFGDFKKATAEIKVPVLFYWGTTDWMIGPNAYMGINFPNVLLWASDVGHVAPVENPDDLARAIKAYRTNFQM